MQSTITFSSFDSIGSQQLNVYQDGKVEIVPRLSSIHAIGQNILVNQNQVVSSPSPVRLPSYDSFCTELDNPRLIAKDMDEKFIQLAPLYQ